MLPNSKPTNTQASELLNAVQAGGSEWQTRRMIAERLNKRWLNPVDVLLLDMLAEQGLIEKVKQPRAGIIAYTLRYRTNGAK